MRVDVKNIAKNFKTIWIPIYEVIDAPFFDGIMIISVIVYMLTNYLGMSLIYLMAAFFSDDSEGVMLILN